MSRFFLSAKKSDKIKVMLIFKLLFIRREIRKGIKDPSGYAVEKIMESFQAVLALASILGGIIVALLFILGYTHLLTEPKTFARIFFWIIFPFFAIGELVFISLFSKTKKFLKNQISRDADIRL